MGGGLSTDLALGIPATESMAAERLTPATPPPDIHALAAAVGAEAGTEAGTEAGAETGTEPSAEVESNARRRRPRPLAEDSEVDEGLSEDAAKAHDLDQLA